MAQNSLIERIRCSDSAAFSELFDHYQQDVFNFLYYKLGNVGAAEDILQDVFVNIWEHRCNLRSDTSMKSYLFTIANRAALNYIRHNKVMLRYQAESEKQVWQTENPYVELERTELHGNLLRAIEKLPEKPRVVLMMSRFDNMSYREVAECLDVSIKTVENHIGKALKLLRERVTILA